MGTKREGRQVTADGRSIWDITTSFVTSKYTVLSSMVIVSIYNIIMKYIDIYYNLSCATNL